MSKAIIVTGSAGSIGSAITRLLIARGFFTVGVDIDSENDDCDRQVRSDISEIANSDEKYRNLCGELDVALDGRTLVGLVNNAAVQCLGPIEHLTRSEISNTFSTNVIAPMLLIQYCLGKLSEGSAIVNISSIHARLTKPGFSAYAASKGALETLTKAVAVEVGDRIRVNAIAPAAIDTPLLRSGLPGGRKELNSLRKLHPTGSIGTPDEVAQVAVFLLDGCVSFLNGSIIDLSGGISSRLFDPF